MTPGERTGLITVGAAVALGSGLYLLYEARKSKTGSGSGGQVGLKVLGYQGFVPGAGSALTTTALGPYASLQSGMSVEGAAQVTNRATSALQVGVRAWIIQGGYQFPGQTLVAPMVTGTVEGHLFPLTYPTPSSPETGTATIPAGQSEVLAFYSAPINGGIASPSGSLSTLGILWAAGPVAAVQALPSASGTLPTTEGIAYVWQPNAIRATFNLVTGVA